MTWLDTYELFRSGCRAGDLELLQQLHVDGKLTEIFRVGDGDQLPTILAAKHGRLDTVKWLVETFFKASNKDLRLESFDLRGMAEAAAQTGQLQTVEWLYNFSRPVNESWCHRVLRQFAYNHHLDGVEWVFSNVTLSLAESLLEDTLHLTKKLSPEALELIRDAAKVAEVGGTCEDFRALRQSMVKPTANRKL